MAKFNHENDYFYKYASEAFDIQHNFTNDLGSGETLSTCTASIYDTSGVDKTASMISSVSISTPSVTFNIANGSGGETYELRLAGVGSGGNTYINKKVCDVYTNITLNTKLGDSSSNSYVTLQEANNYVRDVRGHPNKWDTLSVEGRRRLLVEACRDVNKFNFVGEKYYDNQALEFPRDDHDVISGNCATPLTITSFKNTNFSVSTYGSRRYNTDYWEYGTVHIIAATPLNDARNISANNITTDIITIGSEFSATPTTNTQFKAFEPLDINIKNAQCEQALFLVERDGDQTLQMYKSAGAKSVEIGDVSVSFKDSYTKKASISPKTRNMMSAWIRKYKTILRA